MFQHLDDPVPLPPSTHEQRKATLRRGESLRRRRRAKVFAATAAAAAVLAAFALSPTLRATTEVPPVAASPSPSVAATATVGPGRGSMALSGVVPESVTFTMPAGWETSDGWLFKSDNYGRTSLEGGMPYGFVFLNVTNIYLDGCQWRLIDPAPGPTVDDLVAAYANVPGFGGNASDITVDGFKGKLVEYNVPGYNADDCQEGRFALFKEDRNFGAAPNIVAQAPLQENQIRILDIDGTRLVMLTGYPPDISAAERTELDTIINSIEIG